MGREYPILGENPEMAMLRSKIAPFPCMANITELGGSGQKILTNGENPKSEVFVPNMPF